MTWPHNSGVTTLVGILDEGKAIATAKNISLDTTYEKPNLVRVINAEDYGNDN